MKETLQGLAEIVRKSAGITTQCLGEPMFESALRTRLEATACTDPAAYLLRVRHDPDELQALIELLVVPESWFLRDHAPFAALQRYAREWIAHGHAPLPILSLPCSTGEEPYSIAIALHQAGLAPEQFAIVAADISHAALLRAQSAVYPLHSFRGTDTQFRDQYFEPLMDGRFQLRAAFKQRVEFRQLNVFETSAAELGCYQVIFCRNLLIYFDRETQRRALEKLRAALAPDGLLFVGHAETMAVSQLHLTPHPYPRSFAFLNVVDDRTAPQAPPAPARRRTTKPAAAKAKSSPRPPAQPSKPRPPLAAVTATPAQAEDPAAQLEQAYALANQGETAQALAAVRAHQAAYGPCAHGCFLLGLLDEAQGDLAGAEAWLRKAVYLEPRHAEALTLLALVSERGGDHALARRWRERAVRARQATTS